MRGPWLRLADARFVFPPELAQGVVDAGALAPLVLCLQEPELALRRIAASALSEIAKHTPEVRATRLYSSFVALSLSLSSLRLPRFSFSNVQARLK